MRSKHLKNTFLSFSIHKETFAVSVTKVLEVLQKKYITEIPNAPDYVRGVVNFRGNIIPAIEMRRKFSLPSRSEDEKYVIIVFDLTIENKNIMVGAIADKVNDVFAIEDEAIKPVPDLGLKYNTEFIKGMIKANERFTMILDINKVFSKEDVKIIAETESKAKKIKKPEKK